MVEGHITDDDFLIGSENESPREPIEFFSGFVTLDSKYVHRIANLSVPDQEFMMVCYELFKLDGDLRNVRDAQYVAELTLGHGAFNRIKINEPWTGPSDTPSAQHKPTLKDNIKSRLNRGEQKIDFQ